MLPSSRTRTALPRRSSPSCASAACGSSTCRPTSGCTTAPSTRTGTASTARRRCSATPSTGCRSCTGTRIAGADLVANPGCYPTAAILALAPLARAGLLGDVVIDAKSGVSGAGREPTHDKHFVAVDGTVTPYKVGRHRHTPEIEQELGGDVRVTFTPHLVPLSYGELVSCYVTPRRERRTCAFAVRRRPTTASRGSRSSRARRG